MVTGTDEQLLRRACVDLDVSGAVATVTLNRPEVKNAQTPATWQALRAIGAGLDPAVRVVVVRGAGDSFSSGLDRRLLTPEGLEGEQSTLDLMRLPDRELADAIAQFQEGFTWLRGDRIISVAAVQGHAIGAGFQLALCCDLRVLADDAQLAMREPSLGMVPDLTGTKPLVELVGYSRALELCATGRVVRAGEARDLGLATAVVPRADLDAAVDDHVAALTAAPHGAVADTKALLRSASSLDLDAQRRAEREAQVRRFRELSALLGD
jgi:enoyl-CoA hydratase/carnithine racemase